MASLVAFASDPLSPSWDRLGDPPSISRWRCWGADPGSAFITSNPDTLTAGQTPAGTVLQPDPADGEVSVS